MLSYTLSLKDTNGEFTETCHSTLRKEEEQHGLRIHLYRSKKMLTLYNSLKLGNVMPLKRRRKKTPSFLSPSSSPMSASPSPRTFSFTTSPLVTSFPSSVRRLTSNSFLFTLSPTDGTSPLVTSSPSSAVTFPPKTLVYTPSPTGPSKQCLWRDNLIKINHFCAFNCYHNLGQFSRTNI